ncbi:DUF3320 domain-containing protein [Catenulispora subtropica]|uniref:DUF3320 domain-containing protein n=1 Tax=Catenulispora subtropica TaxID=450798 RepID=A0ABN2QSQ0_9ACTN
MGYGPDEAGKMTMNFGPLNKSGGWRRLNVAVTRAKERVELIASFDADQITGANVSILRLGDYIRYAGEGAAALARRDGDGLSLGGPESPFEESVLSTLRSWGYAPVSQVGAAGFRIDMAVPHPAIPGAFALGIECDGAMYHSSRAARDRDRIREDVLRGLGWRLHRIWGSAWYRDRRQAEEQLRLAVEAAIAAPPVSPPVRESTAAATDVEQDMPVTAPVPAAVPAPRTTQTVVLTDAGSGDLPWVGVYQVASAVCGSSAEMHTPEARPTLMRVLREIVSVEGPIHAELLTTRAREAWGVGKNGSRIRANVDLVLRSLVRRGDLVKHDAVYDVPDRTGPVPVRGRAVDGTAPRRVAWVPPVERRRALVMMVGELPGVSRSELVQAVARVFGWLRKGPDITEALNSDIDVLLADGGLTGSDERIVPAQS